MVESSAFWCVCVCLSVLGVWSKYFTWEEKRLTPTVTETTHQPHTMCVQDNTILTQWITPKIYFWIHGYHDNRSYTMQSNCVYKLTHRPVFQIEHSILHVGCLPNSLHHRQWSSVNITAREVLLYVPSLSTWAFSFFMNRGYDWRQGVLEILWKGKTKDLLCCDKAYPSRDRAWAWLNLSHNQRPTIQQTLPLQTYYCTGAHHSCGESHLGVRGNKCFFNWNSVLAHVSSQCFMNPLCLLFGSSRWRRLGGPD